MSIGVVLERVREEFPEVTVSKIRFLESEGLLTPQRTASGYRRFTEADVERLRYILVTQRDNYTPLKVIREQLEAMDSGQVTALLSAGEADPMISPEIFRRPAMTRLSDSDIAEQASCTVGDIAEFTEAGLMAPDGSGFYTADDVRVATTALALKEFGFDAHQFKRLRTTAERQADLIAQVTQPVAMSGADTAQQRAEEVGQQITALVVSLHAGLVKNALQTELDK